MDGLLSLLASTEYEGLVIKEWNIIQFAKLSRVLTGIAKEYKTKNIAWEGFSAILEKEENVGIAGLADGGIAGISQSVLEFITPFVEHAPEILQVSCSVDQKKLESMTYSSGLVALMLVLKVNLEHLTRFFGTLVAANQEQAATTSTPQ